MRQPVPDMPTPSVGMAHKGWTFILLSKPHPVFFHTPGRRSARLRDWAYARRSNSIQTQLQFSRLGHEILRPGRLPDDIHFGAGHARQRL